MRKRDLRTWIAEQNESKGFAPTTDLVQRRLLLADGIYGPLQPPRPALSLSPASTKWVQRFRRQWKLRRGARQPRETLPQDVLLRRAPKGVRMRLRVPISGAKILRGRIKNRCRFPAPFWGPRFQFMIRRRLNNGTSFCSPAQKKTRLRGAGPGGTRTRMRPPPASALWRSTWARPRSSFSCSTAASLSSERDACNAQSPRSRARARSSARSCERGGSMRPLHARDRGLQRSSGLIYDLPGVCHFCH